MFVYPLPPKNPSLRGTKRKEGFPVANGNFSKSELKFVILDTSDFVEQYNKENLPSKSWEVAVHYTSYRAVSVRQASLGDLYCLANQFLNKQGRQAFLDLWFINIIDY